MFNPLRGTLTWVVCSFYVTAPTSDSVRGWYNPHCQKVKRGEPPKLLFSSFGRFSLDEVFLVFEQLVEDRGECLVRDVLPHGRLGKTA